MAYDSPTPDASDLATKGEAVEEWLDLRFFRPVGARIARAAYPTRVSPDQLTLICLLVGLVAGHLFVYDSPALNAAGFVLFIVSDIFDSADGQLARLRRTSTRFGRILDGVSDNGRFINLYIHLCIRLVHGGWSVPGAFALALGAGLSHSTQSAAVDFIRHAFLAIGVGRGSELGDAADSGMTAGRPASVLRRLAIAAYHAYTARQRRMFPATWALVGRVERGDLSAVARGAYRQRAGRLLPVCVWLGQNIRFVILGIAGVSGHPSVMLWTAVLPMNILMIGLVLAQERATRRVCALMGGIAAPEPVGIA
jgi:hypothetical protein